jgi:hypothetical protein
VAVVCYIGHGKSMVNKQNDVIARAA